MAGASRTRRPRTGPVEVVATGRGSWIGWVELKTEAVDELAMRHTAMVIRDVDADVCARLDRGLSSSARVSVT